MSSKQNRSIEYDVLKCGAIYLVILGHCLGRLGLGNGIFENPVGKAIIMVNMPLFIFISGFFSSSIHKRSIIDLLIQKYKQLVRPTIVYSIIMCAISCILLNEYPDSFIGGGKMLIKSVITTYWFVWVLLYCTLFNWVTGRISRWLSINKYTVQGILLILILLIPRDYRYIPFVSYFQAMCPFYLIGSLFKEKDLVTYVKSLSSVWIFLLLGVYLFLAIISKEDQSFYFYVKMNLTEVIVPFLYMLITGMIGITGILLLANRIVERHATSTLIINLSYIGQYTLAIYLLQGIVIGIFDCLGESVYIHSVSLMVPIAILASIVIFAVSAYLSALASKNQITARYLLGK